MQSFVRSNVGAAEVTCKGFVDLTGTIILTLKWYVAFLGISLKVLLGI